MQHRIRPWLITLLCVGFSILAHANDLKEQLNHTLTLDQQHRTAIQQLEKNAGSKKEIKQLKALQNTLDVQNANTLHQIIQQLGHWPGIDDVGENVAKMALIIVKHASIEQQTELFPEIKKAAQNKQIKPEWFAYLYDQHLMDLGLPQAYGSLMTKGAEADQKLYPMQPLNQVNNNRASIGLPSLNQTLAEKSIWLRPNLLDENHFELVDVKVFEQFAELALTCLDQTYPNSIKHVMNNEEDAQTPDQMHPTFFGCFDWHSSVHGHWLLVKALKTFPDHPAFQNIKPRLAAHFTKENMAQELAYFKQDGRNSYERPYGMAWYLQLVAELHTWHDPEVQQWRRALQPLEQEIKAKLDLWVPKLTHPIRNGTHTQTAFAFGMMLDYAKTVGDFNFQNFLLTHINRFYTKDKKCPINYEPSGHDFLSACLAEADLMRRVFINPKAYQKWLKKFLPQIKHGSNWLQVANSTDPSDGHLSHMDGLNISRAWMLEGMASALSLKDKRRAILLRQADNHRKSGLAAVTGEHYAGGHWLGSFAMYYLTQSGINK